MQSDLFRAASACSAFFSEDRRFRYWLGRTWQMPCDCGKSRGLRPDHEAECREAYISTKARDPIIVCGLNPSDANEQRNDPTIHRCMHFARAWNHDGLLMVNAYALVSSDPKALLSAPEPVGAETDVWLSKLAAGRRVLAAWGCFSGGSLEARAEIRQRIAHVANILRFQAREMVCLGYTADKSPIHPLARGKHRVPDSAQPIPFVVGR